MLLMLIPCHARYRRYKQRQAQKPDTRTSQPKSSNGSLVDDSFGYSNPRDWATMVRRWKQYFTRARTDNRALEPMESGFMPRNLAKQRADVEVGASYEVSHPRLAGIIPRFAPDYRVDDRDLPMSQPPPYDKAPSTVGHLSVITQPRAYLPFSNWRVSETPSSPSIYPPSLSGGDDSDSFCQPPIPTGIARNKNPAAPDQSHNRGINTKKRSVRRVPVKPEVYRTSPDSGDDQSSPGVVQQEPSYDGDRRPVPPPIPPKSHLRAAMPMQTMYGNCEFPRFTWSLFSVLALS